MNQVRKRNSKERCPACDEMILVHANATTMKCPHCSTRLGVIGNRSHHRVEQNPDDSINEQELSDTARALGFKTQQEYIDFLNRPMHYTSTKPEEWQLTRKQIESSGKSGIMHLKSERAKANRFAHTVYQKNAVRAQLDPKIRLAEQSLSFRLKDHERHVKDALTAGKVVPANVLADYPELAGRLN